MRKTQLHSLLTNTLKKINFWSNVSSSRPGTRWANKGHYQMFNDVFGTETTKIYSPSAELKEQKNLMGFTAFNQHALNTNLTLSIQNVISHNLFMLITCLIPVEKLYYSTGCDACCCRCGSKRKLITCINCCPIWTLCKR